MLRHLTRALVGLFVLCPPVLRAQSPPAARTTDLDAFMAQALQRRDIDRKVLSDYVLDEVEEFEVLGPGRVPFARMKREYTWYVRDGVHVRSPLKFDGVPIPETDRRAYEERWIRSEESRRKFRTTRDEKRPRFQPVAVVQIVERWCCDCFHVISPASRCQPSMFPG